jgi:hypothetical protein
MPGAPDPLYVAARGVLLDALEALREHITSLVLFTARSRPDLTPPHSETVSMKA